MSTLNNLQFKSRQLDFLQGFSESFYVLGLWVAAYFNNSELEPMQGNSGTDAQNCESASLVGLSPPLPITVNSDNP